MPKANPVPEGFRTVSPYLIIRDCAQAIDWYKKALGAEEVMRMPGPNGAVMHAEIRIGDSMLMCGEEYPQMGCLSPAALGGSPVKVHLYVENCDVLFNRAVAAGAQVTMPVMDMFWGDRFGQFTDPYGHSWSVATHVEDVSPEECARRGDAAMKEMGGGCCGEGHDHGHPH